MAVENLFDYIKGQGRVYINTRDSNGNPAGAWEWLGDIPSFEFGQAPDELKVKENYTGNRGNALTLITGLDTTFTMNVRNLSPKIAALLLSGTSVDVNSGNVTNEAFRNPVAVGEVDMLAKNGAISSLVITDSAGSPGTATLNTHYTHDGYGLITWLSLGAFTQPFKAAYSFAAHKKAYVQNAAIANRIIRIRGLNTARKTAGSNYARFTLTLYNCSLKPGEAIQFIQPDNIAEIALAGSFDIDPLKTSSSTSSQYGELVYDDLT